MILTIELDSIGLLVFAVLRFSKTTRKSMQTIKLSSVENFIILSNYWHKDWQHPDYVVYKHKSHHSCFWPIRLADYYRNDQVVRTIYIKTCNIFNVRCFIYTKEKCIL